MSPEPLAQFVWTSFGIEPCPALECGSSSRVTLLGTAPSLPRWPSNANGSSVSGWISCFPTIQSRAWTLSGLILWWPCACCHNHWVFTCATPGVSGRLCFLDIIHHLCFLQSFAQLLSKTGSLGGVIGAFPVGPVSRVAMPL